MFFKRFLLKMFKKKYPSNLFLDSDMTVSYMNDESGKNGEQPLGVFFPENSEDVKKMASFCYRYKIPYIVRGKGTGKTGGAVPVKKSLIIVMERMNRIIIDTKNLTAEVEPGAITLDIQKAAAEENLFYPVDPASLDSCSIGGNIAENAGGPRAFKYGVTRDFVLGLDVVLPNGDFIRLGGKTRKDVSGYNLKDIFIGSEGTLGTVTKAYLKLLPLPKEKILVWAVFDDFFEAVEAMSAVYQTSLTPSCIEFIEGRAFQAVEKMLHKPIPDADSQAHLLIEVDGFEKDGVLKQGKALSEVLYRFSPKRISVLPYHRQQEKIWNLRRQISEATKHASFDKKSEDICVPPANLKAFLEAMREIEKVSGVDIICFGHLGDGNVHVNILNIKDETGITWKKFSKKIVYSVFDTAIKLGGTLSGEHGIGLTKKKYFSAFTDPEIIMIHKKLKKLFDPKKLLNPKKIWK